MVFGSLAMVGTAARLIGVILSQPDQWTTFQSRIADIAPLIGLGVFAATACMLLLLLVRSEGQKWLGQATADLRFSQLFIVVAVMAMLARVVSEPDTIWTPQWQSYSLTLSAATAMGMVWLRFRRGLAHFAEGK